MTIKLPVSIRTINKYTSDLLDADGLPFATCDTDKALILVERINNVKCCCE